MIRDHQVSFLLPQEPYDILRRLSAETGKPYAGVISMALAAMENSLPASQVASLSLVVYAYLPDHERQTFKELVRQWRSTGGSYAAIGKRLYVEKQISGVDRLPLSASTIRSICAR